MTSLETCTVRHGLIFHVPDQIAHSKDDDLLEESNEDPELVVETRRLACRFHDRNPIFGYKASWMR
jgi:hypothetical protein